MSRPVALTVVRAIARLVSLTFAPRVRRMTNPTFVEWADHRWQRERGFGASAPRAAGRAVRALVADALTTAPATWMLFAAANEVSDPLAAPRRWWRRPFDGGGRDIRLAWRAVHRAPGFAALVILTIGLGVGASAASFDALDRTVLRPLPFKDSDRLAQVSMRDKRNSFSTPRAAAVAAWRQSATLSSGFVVARDLIAVRTGDGPAERLDTLGISPSLPAFLDIKPIVGRMLGPADAADGAPNALMITERYWRSHFGGDQGVSGRTLQLAGVPWTIAGVWPDGARLIMRAEPIALVRVFKAKEELSAGSLSYVFLKLAPGADLPAAEAELSALMPATPDRGPSGDERPAITPPTVFLGDAYVSGVWLVFAGSIGLLLVAVANAGHLLAVRAGARRFELGVRIALGGSMPRIARLIVFESLIFGLGGVAAGLVMALGFEELMRSYEPRLFAPVLGAGLGGRALIFAPVLALLSAVMCSIAPLVVMRSTDAREVISTAGAGRATARRSRLRTAAIGAQAALAIILITGAAVMVRSYTTLMRLDTGIAIDRLATISVSAPARRYPTPELRRAFLRRVREALETTPGVVGLTTSGMPIMMASIFMGVPHLEGEPEPPDDATAITAGGGVPVGFFEVMGLRLVAGRFFQPGDKDVAIVTENFARARAAVVGRKLVYPRGRKTVEVVGVVGDTRTFGMAAKGDRVTVYEPIADDAESTFQRFMLRTDRDPAVVLSAARARLAEIDPEVPPSERETGMDVVRRQTAQFRLVAVLLASLAALGLLLAMAGMYGAVAMDVSRRTREVGIRLALGATRHQIASTVLRRGLVPVVAGGAVGLILAQLATPRLESLLFNVSARDPLSAIAGAVLIVIAAVVACLIPARRAARIDPVRTLRA